ncbi:signal recognition particle-docking protein FtsY [bacterium]|nr:signal recognition particle-docking protein FtsY [bacterium]
MSENKQNWIKRLAHGLSKTHNSLIKRIDALLWNRPNLSPELIEELEETLILADCGVQTSSLIITRLKERYENERDVPSCDILKAVILEILQKAYAPLNTASFKPFVMMVLGVNGVGKTTTIAKMANRLTDQGRHVILIAGDTFRAAAIEQLQIWADSINVKLIKHQIGSDPSAVVFDGIQAARTRGTDCVIVDTAGRLHTKKNLVAELEKMKKVMGREIQGAPHETLLVLDATTGQNAIQQAREFHQKIGLTGIALTKLDGTAKGGIIISIANELSIPVKLIGIGEGIDDLRDFDPHLFVDALFEESEAGF